MTDYTELVKALRYCVNARNCKKCGFRLNNNSVKCRIQRVEDAAAAIEELEKERDYYKRQYENRQRLIKCALGEEWT